MTDADTHAGTDAGGAAVRPTSPVRPAGRYGRRAGRPAAGWLPALLLALVLAAGLGIALVAYRNLGGPGVSATVTAFTTRADHVDITFVVQRNKSNKRAICLLRARSDLGVEVGSATVSVPPGGDPTRLTYRLPTSTRAVTGEVTGCRYPDPG